MSRCSSLFTLTIAAIVAGSWPSGANAKINITNGLTTNGLTTNQRGPVGRQPDPAK